MKKLLPIILVVLGIAGGGAAGVFLKPAPEPVEAKTDTAEAPPEPEDQGELQGKGGGSATERTEPSSYIKIGRQTIVPVVEGGETRALMMFELAIDVPPSLTDRTLQMEPRLRDVFLRELFLMSNTGAFLTNFTDDRVIEELRLNLTHAARQHLGDGVKEVLILDVIRQEQ